MLCRVYQNVLSEGLWKYSVSPDGVYCTYNGANILAFFTSFRDLNKATLEGAMPQEILLNWRIGVTQYLKKKTRKCVYIFLRYFNFR